MFDWLFGRRRKLIAAPFPTNWEAILADNVRHVRYLPADRQEYLHNCVKVIVAERHWDGVSGLKVTDEMKVTVAAQAALLLLGNEGYYFDRVSQVLLHPRLFQSRSTKWNLHKRFEETISATGLAHSMGSVVLTWPEALAGGRGETGGDNLVLHEFAHHLDSLDGEMAGLPPLPSQEAIERWKEVTEFEYQQLVNDVEHGRPGLLDPYGATNKAEFFAVATECFYELPRAMQDDYPELYALLADFYRIDPSQWWPDALKL